ncbi:MAG TPA: IS1595 family transposase [Xanthobacteraceae bacterium]|nr:IS1595 family transposase [Xanthobacteraceae bacterium]
MNALNAAHFQNDDAARKYVEAIRWPSGPVCGKCGSLKSYATSRPGVYRCAEPECRADFSVMTGTVMERSHIPLHKWLSAFYLMASSKKGMSAHQLHRTLKITYKSAWFLAHRVREAMRTGGLEPLGGAGKIVEADETYFGKANNPRPSPQRKGRPFIKKGHVWNNRPILALVERGGSVRTFHVPVADKANVQAIVAANISRESRLHTDESRLYFGADEHFASHETVKHSAGEYVRDDVHTNSAEGYFSIFKRGMRGVYQHCGEKHLHRYLAEFDFRYNNRSNLGVEDGERAVRAVKGAEGKRLTYRLPH